VDRTQQQPQNLILILVLVIVVLLVPRKSGHSAQVFQLLIYKKI